MLSAGRVSKLFGAGGEVVITLGSDFPDDFDWKERPLFVRVDGLVVPLFCESFTRRGSSSAVVLFADIDTPARAGIIVGRELFIEECADDTAADDEFTLDDLAGFAVTVVATDGRQERHGTVTDFYDHEANPLFEIEIDGAAHLVPAVDEFIAAIDFDARTLRLVLPEGLLEL